MFYSSIGCQSVSAQTSKLDSLRNVSADSPEDPALKVDYLIEHSVHFLDSKQDSAYYFSTEALKLADSLGDDHLIARAKLAVGNSVIARGKASEALPYFNEVFKKAKTMEKLDLLKEVTLSLIRTHGEKGNLQEKKKYCLELQELCQQIGDSVEMAYAIIQLGDLSRNLDDNHKAKTYFIEGEELLSYLGKEANEYRFILWLYQGDFFWDVEGNSVKASQNFLKVLDLAEQENDFKYKFSALYYLGSLHRENKDYEKALEYLLSMEDMLKGSGRLFNLAFAYNSLANTYHDLKKVKESIQYRRKTFEVCVEIGAVNRAAMSSSDLALAYLREGRLDSAEYFYDYAFSNSRVKNNLIGNVNMSFRMGQYNVLKGDLSSGQQLLMAAYENSEEQHLALKTSIAANLADLYAQLGQYQKAYEFNSINKSLSDSLFNRDKVREMTRLESEFEFDQEKQQIQAKNERELLLRDQELQRQQLMIIIGIILAFSSIAVGFLFARFRIRSKAQEAEKLREISSFKEAMTGMIAHDLKNPLGVIMGTESGKPTTRNMARQMLSLVNNMLDVQKFEQAEVKLKLESVSVAKLITESVEQVRVLLDEKNVKVNYNFEDDAAINIDRELLLRVLINLLTNAIKYTPQNSTITIETESNKDKLKISVSDEGKGIPEEQLEHIFSAYQQYDPRRSGEVGSTGLGLTFCKLALEAHNSTISVNSSIDSGTTFSFELAKAQDLNEIQALGDQIFTLTEEDKEIIFELLPKLREYKLHQAMQMESVLGPLKDTSEAVDNWVEQVLNAAYSGNESYFNDLLDQVESPD